MTPPSFRALVVEDDHSWQEILSEILTDCGMEVDVAGNLNEAVHELKSQSHRLAIVDLSLEADDHNNYDGLRVLETVRNTDPGCQTILLTGFATVELAVSVLTEFGAFTFLRKENFNRHEFRENVYRSLASAPKQAILEPDSEPLTDTLATRPDLSSSPSAGAARVLVVEDDAGWRDILEELLVDAGFQVRICSGFGDALGSLRREKFTLAILDLSLTGDISDTWNPNQSHQNLEGYQLLENTKAGNIPTIVVSGVASPGDIMRAYAEQSIFAYIEKQTFDREVFRRLVEEASAARLVGGELSNLTDREREVLELLAYGMTNKEIAEKLVITTNTVKRHLKAIFEKLNVHTRSAAAAIFTSHVGPIKKLV
ncbi:MAG: response regulator [Anaerolineales bacterium]|nr:response regulator [Anaerolineales bacterium]